MDKEISIIGAGSTGLSAAIFLESLGYKPRIFEKRNRTPITKALGINPVTLQLFEKSGITQQFLKNGWKLECINFWQKNELIYKNDFSKIKHPYPFMLIQPQHETEDILERYLAEKGIHVERQFELNNLIQQEKTVTLDFDNLNSSSTFRYVTNGIVIGADGSKSKVREALGLKFEGWSHPDDFTLYDIELETPLDPREGHYRFYREGGMLMIHIRNGVWRVVGNLHHILNYLPAGTKSGKISWEANFNISEKMVDTYNIGHAHLLGDAAHIHSPLGAKGMNMCIEDSYIFAELYHRNLEKEFTQIRRKKVKHTIGVLRYLTDIAIGQNLIGNSVRNNMKRMSFLFPLIMPYTRKFLLGLK